MTPTDLLELVSGAINRHGLIRTGDTVVVGVSGGPDSLCLLHVLRELATQHEFSLYVAHLHHGIRGAEADADAMFVAELAESWNIPARIEFVDTPALAAANKVALEEAARRARYTFLGSVAIRQGASSIAVGHNSDDQTETIVMHWLRGAGMAGLRGMLPSTPLAGLRLWRHDQQRFAGSKVRIIRPLLEVSRTQVMEYCRAHNLEPRFDRSNLDTTYFRNRLRHELIPLLETYNPNFRQVAQRAAMILADDYALLRTLLSKTWKEIVIAESSEAIIFDLEAWRVLPVSLQRSTIREAIHRLRRSLRNINWIHTQAAVTALRAKPVSTRVTLPSGLMLTLAYDRFTIADAEYVPTVTDYPQLTIDALPVTVPGVTTLPSSSWVLETEVTPRDVYDESHSRNRDPWQAFLDFEAVGVDLLLRRRQPGDRFQPLGLDGHQQSIRDFMINAKIPRRARDKLPLLISSLGTVWIPGWRIDTRARVTESTSIILHLTLKASSEGSDSDG